MTEVKATKTGLDKEAIVNVDLGDNLQDAVAKFGEETVFSGFQAQAKIRAQSIIRDMMVEGKTNDEIQEFMNTWKPGITRERVSDPTAAFLNKFSGMTKEDQEKFLEQLIEKAKTTQG